MSDLIKVSEGVLQGESRLSCDGKQYHSFEGIPYALPPLGKLRFRDPQQSECWTGIRDARKPGNFCVQIKSNAEKPLEGSEDCLYLNVYTPSLPVQEKQKLAVLFFIHGGGFLYGYGHYYQPDYIIRHDVILVTFNYRLHILGFLCLNTPEIPGNAAMKDTVMALKWVKNNIASFNGDSNNITVCGESGGAGIATSYLTSKLTDGLFNKVIAQSLTCISEIFLTEDDTIEKARNVAKILGNDVSDVKELQNFLIHVPVPDLILAVGKAESKKRPGDIKPNFLPIVEKKFIGVERFFEKHPYLVIQENNYKNLPILLGVCSHEGAFIFDKSSTGELNFVRNLKMFIPQVLSIKYNTSEALAIAKRFQEYYFKCNKINKNMLPEYIDFISDAYLLRDIMMFTELCARNTQENIYLYRFAYHGSINTRIMSNLGLKGTTHGDTLPYLFYRKNKFDKCSEKDAQVVDMLSEAWCNFATNGKPTWTHQKFEWPPYRPDKKCCLNIDDQFTVDSSMKWNRYDFWKSIMERKCKM